MTAENEITLIQPRSFSMSELVERSATPAATVRYYLAEGLLPAPSRAKANRYLYDERHVEIIRFIRLLQDRRGMSLEEIRRLLPDLLPDLLDSPSPGVFRPEMFAQLISVASRSIGPTVAEQLIDAGVSAFSSRAFAEVSVDDICRAVKIAKGSFYRHFSSKEALFTAVIGRIPALIAGALASGASLDVAVGPHLTTVLELASLSSRDRDQYRAVLGTFLDGLARSLVDAGVTADLAVAEREVGALLGCVVMALGRAHPEVPETPRAQQGRTA